MSMITIQRDDMSWKVDEIDYTDLRPDDLVILDDIRDVASDLVEYVEFMEKSFYIGFKVKYDEFDSRTAIGKIMLDMFTGLAEYNRRVFCKH